MRRPIAGRTTLYEALKGLPIETHRMDSAGVHLSSGENQYTIRTLYEGLDGRGVRYAFLSQADSLLYDTGASSPGSERHCASWVRRRRLASIRLRNRRHRLPTRRAWRICGAPAKSTPLGTKHIAPGLAKRWGSECPQQFDLPADEAITQVTEPTLIEHTGGWMWRTAASYVIGSVHEEQRRRMVTTYDAFGRPSKVEALLTGSAAGGPLRRLGAWPGRRQRMVFFTQNTTAYVRVRQCGLHSSCRRPLGGELLHDDATSSGLRTCLRRSVDDCDGRRRYGGYDAQRCAAVRSWPPVPPYDHALGAVTPATDLNLRNTLAARFDGFWWITALHKPSATYSVEPAQLLQAAPSVIIEYFLPDVLVVRIQHHSTELGAGWRNRSRYGALL